MTVPRFWREIPQRYNLQGARCGACQGVYFPPREVCPACRRASIGKMEPMRLSGAGTLLEWTRVHKPAPGYALQVPYLVALIRTPEGPILTGQVVDADPASLAPGMPLRAVFRRIGEDGESGVIHYGTKWVPDGSPAPAKASADAAQKETKPGKTPKLRRWKQRPVQTA